MTHLVARLILTMLILPISGAVFVLGMAVVAMASPQNTPLQAPPVLLLWSVVYLVIGATWIMIWKPVVRWTPKRIAQTVTTGVVALAAGVAFGFAIFMIGQPTGLPIGIAVLIGGGFPPIAWVLATVMVWRETNAERTARLAGGAGAGSVVCPMCGYDLRGAKMARCPECGVEFTIGQLVQAQPARALQALDHESGHD